MKANSLIVATLLFAMTLSIMIVPSWMLWMRPEFTLMVLVYWAMAIPDRFGLLPAMLVGLFQDSLTATVIGEHMLGYVLVVSFVLFTYQRLRMLGAWQQAFVIFFLFAGAQFLESRLAIMTGQQLIGWWWLMPAFSSALLWPWLMVSLRILRRKLRVLNKFYE